MVKEKCIKLEHYVLSDNYVHFTSTCIKTPDAKYGVMTIKTELSDVEVLKIPIDKVQPKVKSIQILENLTYTLTFQVTWLSDGKPMSGRGQGFVVYLPELDEVSSPIDDDGLAYLAISLSALRKVVGSALVEDFNLELRTKDLLPMEGLLTSSLPYRKAALSVILQNKSFCILKPIDWYDLTPLINATVIIFADGEAKKFLTAEKGLLAFSLEDFSDSNYVNALLIPWSDRRIIYDPVPFGNITLMADISFS